MVKFGGHDFHGFPLTMQGQIKDTCIPYSKISLVAVILAHGIMKGVSALISQIRRPLIHRLEGSFSFDEIRLPSIFIKVHH